MSEEKKTTWGSASASQEPRQEPPGSPGATQQVIDASQPINDAEEPDPEQPARGRNQNVLPGILGKQLRSAYGELLNSPVPDRITDLIKQLETMEAGKPATSKARDGEESK